MNKLYLKIILVLVVMVLIIGTIVIYTVFLRQPNIQYTFVAANKGTITDVVKVEGEVKAAQEVKLTFERSAKIAVVNVKAGDQVKSGQALASLVNSDLNAQLAQAVAGLRSAQALLSGTLAGYQAQVNNLNNLKNGPRPEDLAVSQTQVDSAEKAVSDAQLNLNNVKTKAQTDLNNLYNKTSDVLNDAYAKAFDAINIKIADLFTNATTDNPSLNFQTSNSSLEFQVKTERVLVNSDLNTIRNIIDNLSTDQGGIDNSAAAINTYLNNVRNFLNDLNQLMNYSIISTNFSQSTLDIAKANISLGLSAVNAAIASLQSQVQLIASQKVLNQNLITAAETQLNVANNNLTLAQKQLTLKKAGATADQISAQTEVVKQAEAQVAAQRAVVSQAQANVLNYQSQLAKSVIVSPIDGIITQQDAKVGEIAPLSAPVISVISNAKFQIETHISENDIAKVKVGQPSEVTLDAYGSDKIFLAKVIMIDPAEIIYNSAPTYKVMLEFLNEDKLIKDGLTANVRITISEKKDVIIVPELSVIHNEESFVLVASSSNSNGVEERKVVTGIKQNGEIEIVSGLNIGDKVVDFGQIQ